MSKDFTVVFKKLTELQTEQHRQETRVDCVSPESLTEMDEISELCKIVAEIDEPEPLSYTTT